MKNRKRPGIRHTHLLLAALLLPGMASGDEAPVSMALRRSVEVATPAVQLGDVVVLRGADAARVAQIAAIPLDFPSGSGATMQVTHQQLTDLLNDHGVNLGTVLLSGAAACNVQLQAAPDGAADGASEKPAALKPRSRLSDRTTLADLLRARVQSELRDAGVTVELEFEQAGQDFLALTQPPFDFIIQSNPRAAAGLREFRVTIQQDGVTQRTVRIFARTRVTRPVLIAKNPLNIGAYLTRDDITIEERTFAEGDAAGLSNADALLGQRLQRFVDRGEMLTAVDLKSEPLVKRSRPVQLISDAGGVGLRLTGVALDNGFLGETVRVRVGENRGKRRELRGVVSGVGQLKLSEVD